MSYRRDNVLSGRVFEGIGSICGLLEVCLCGFSGHVGGDALNMHALLDLICPFKSRGLLRNTPFIDMTLT